MKNSSKLLMVMLMAFGIFAGNAFGQGKIKGTVTDKYQEPAPGAKIFLYKDGGFYKGMYAEDDGKYEFAPLSPGTYKLQIYFGKDSVIRDNIVLSIGETRPLDVVVAGYESEGVVVEAQADGPPLFTVDPIVSETVTLTDIKHRGVRDLYSTIGPAAGVYQPDGGSGIQVRGGRTGATVTFVDGVKMVGTPGVPQPMYGQVSLITGGLPAEFGDVTGGVIAVTTRNPGMKGWVGKPANYDKKMERKQKREEKKKDDDRSMLDVHGDNSFAMN